MLERGTICGSRGQRLTASQKVRFLKHGIDVWSIQNVKYRLLYLRFMIFTEACFTLLTKKDKSMAIQDRNRHWKTEADNLEQTWQEGRTRELYSIARILW